MKKLTIIALIFGLFSCGSSFNQNELSNNPGNIINHGIIVSDKDNIYYISKDSTDGLFSQELNGTNIKRLSNDHIEFLNLVDGWLYFRKSRSSKNPQGGGLYKMKIDGTQEQRLTSDEPFYINVVNDWIYYVNWSSSTDICKIKTDGTESQKLYSGHYQCLTTDGTNLYFGTMAGPGTSLLFRGSFNGHDIKQISKDTIQHFFVYGDWIYYKKDFNKICRMNKNNFKIDTLLVSDNLGVDYIIPDKNFLYLGGTFGIKKFDILEKRIYTLLKTRIIQLGIAGGYSYFTTAEWDSNNDRHTNTFLITLDSLKNQMSNKNK